MRPQKILSAINASIFWRGLWKLSSIIKIVIIASAIGLSAQLDIYFLATSILGLIVFSLGAVFNIAAIPSLVELNVNNKNDKFNLLASSVFKLTFIIGVILFFLVYFLNDFLSEIMIGLDEERRLLLKQSFIYLLPIALLYVPYSFLLSLFRSIKNYAVTFKAEFISGIIPLILIIIFTDNKNVLLWSYSVGVVVAFLYIFTHSIIKFDLNGPLWSEILKPILAVIPGLFAVQSIQYIFSLTDRFFVSFLSVGEVGALAIGWKFMLLIPGMIGLTSIFITIYSERKSQDKNRIEIINDLISISLIIGIPISFFMSIYNNEIVSMFLQWGVFTEESSAITAKSLFGFAPAFIPLLIGPAIDQIFQVDKKIKIMVIRRIVGVLANIILNSIFLFILDWGLTGIALATAFSYLFMLITLFIALKKDGYEINWTGHIVLLTRLIMILGVTSFISIIFLSAILTSAPLIISHLLIVSIIFVIYSIYLDNSYYMIIKKYLINK